MLIKEVFLQKSFHVLRSAFRVAALSFLEGLVVRYWVVIAHGCILAVIGLSKIEILHGPFHRL